MSPDCDDINDVTHLIADEVHLFFKSNENCNIKGGLYHQLSSQIIFDDHTVELTPLSTHGVSKSHEKKFTALAALYFKTYFPNLHPISCRYSDELDTQDILSRSKALPLLSVLEETQNLLLIPTFSPLNRIGIFTLELHTEGRNETNPVEFSARISQMLAKAQACHLKICDHQNCSDPGAVTLTMRERQILQWIARGKSNSVIADILGISLHTVSGYLRNVYLKTETNDRTSAAIFAIKNGLLFPPAAASKDAA